VPRRLLAAFIDAPKKATSRKWNLFCFRCSLLLGCGRSRASYAFANGKRKPSKSASELMLSTQQFWLQSAVEHTAFSPLTCGWRFYSASSHFGWLGKVRTCRRFVVNAKLHCNPDLALINGIDAQSFHMATPCPASWLARPVVEVQPAFSLMDVPTSRATVAICADS
jgi:hypothetical protein